MKKINFMAGLCFLAVGCVDNAPVTVKYERQEIPQALLECEQPPQCDSNMQSDVAQCLLEYDRALDDCHSRIDEIKKLQQLK